MNKRDVKTKEDLELYYNQCRKIKFADDIKPDNISKIFELIRTKSESVATYFKNGSEQCSIRRYRSIDDYIKLCKFYFPETTLKEMINTVNHYILNKGENGQWTRIEWCPNIRKDNCRTSYYFNQFESETFQNRYLTEQGFPNCQITYKQLI